jgi:hypothetical protein
MRYRETEGTPRRVTSEVLYQLSYVGERSIVALWRRAILMRRRRDPRSRRTRRHRVDRAPAARSAVVLLDDSVVQVLLLPCLRLVRLRCGRPTALFRSYMLRTLGYLVRLRDTRAVPARRDSNMCFLRRRLRSRGRSTDGGTHRTRTLDGGGPPGLGLERLHDRPLGSRMSRRSANGTVSAPVLRRIDRRCRRARRSSDSTAGCETPRARPSSS